MPDPRLPSSTPGTFRASHPEHTRPTYRIMRKGSRYNILGPQGRVFTKYQSASDAGPRWEELTHTPWPYASSAYARGYRLWELGLIPREDVGKLHIEMEPVPEPEPRPARAGGRPKSQPTQPPIIIVLIAPPVMALPAPRIDLAEHERLMQALRRNPVLLFEPKIQEALRHEVEYHRPQARWAQHLLDLLVRYEKRQQVLRRHKVPAEHSSASILAKHLAWQTQHPLAGV